MRRRIPRCVRRLSARILFHFSTQHARSRLTTILISRFLLDLGAFGVPNNGTDASTEGAGLGTMQFASELSDSHAESEGSVKRGTTWMSEDEYELGVR